MYTNSILAVSGLLSFVAAVPMAHEHHHRHQQRDYVWVTETEEAVVTVPVTQTVWLEAGETAPGAPQNNRPVFTSHIQQTVTLPSPSPESSSWSAESPAPYVPPTTSSTSQYVAPTSAVPSPPPAPPASSSSSVYMPPPAPTSASTSSVYVPPAAPTTSSTSQYVPPAAPTTSAAPTSTWTPPAYSAPASSSSASTQALSGGSGSESVQAVSNSVTGMAASGKSFTGDLTYYAVGMGSCGETSSESDIIVAVSHVIMSTYNGGNPNANPLCGKTVSIKALDGTTHHAKIVDTCPGCDVGSLDLPEAFFNAVTTVNGKPGDGRVKGVEWSFD